MPGQAKGERIVAVDRKKGVPFVHIERKPPFEFQEDIGTETALRFDQGCGGAIFRIDHRAAEDGGVVDIVQRQPSAQEDIIVKRGRRRDGGSLWQ